MVDRVKRAGGDGAAAAGRPEGDQEPRPRSVELAARGLRTCNEVGIFLDALLGDAMTEKVTARLAGVAVNIVGKRLKAAELAIRYGTSVTPEGEKDREAGDRGDPRGDGCHG